MIVDQVRITRVIDVGIVNDPAAAVQVALADGYGPINVRAEYVAPTFDPRSLFAAGEKGVIYDFTKPSTLYTTAAGSTHPASAGDFIGRVTDLSPNGLDATGAVPPALASRGGVFCAHANGIAAHLDTAACDLGPSGNLTVVIGWVRVGDASISAILGNNNAGAPNGAFVINPVEVINNNTIYFQVHGATAWGGCTSSVQVQSPAVLTTTVVYNLTGSRTDARVSVNGAAALLSGAAGGLGTAFDPTQPLNLFWDGTFGASAKVDCYRVIAIGRALSADEITAAERWVGAPIPALFGVKAIMLGDSTITGYGGMLSVANFSTRFSANIMATVSQTIAQQRTLFDAMPSYSMYNAIIIAVGVNDLNPAETAATALSRYQALVNSVNAKKTAGTKVIVCAMTPCKAFLISAYGAIDGATAYQKWLDMNAAIAGNGPNAITGADARVASHATALNDGSGNLAAAYDIGDHLHENNAGRAIFAAAIDAGLVSVGL